MKRPDILSISLVCLLLLAGSRMAAQVTPPVSATGHISAEVIPVFSASETSQMNFGKFSPGPQGGQIILTPMSTISVQGSVFKGSGTHNAASFYLTGEIDASFSISLPTSPVVLTHSSDAKKMLVEGWASIPSPGIGSGKLLEGFQTIYVGATLKVGPTSENPVGIYTGSYSITFDFN